MAKSVYVISAAVAGFIGRTVALAVSTTSQCDVFEYYDVNTGTCRHCDTACFEHENGTIVGFSGDRCQQLCPGYIKEPRVPHYPRVPEQVALTLMEGSLIGIVLAVFIVCLIVCLIVLRSDIYAALKSCVHSARDLSAVTSVYGRSNNDVTGESSYVKLADPSDDVLVIIDRVTTV